MPDASNYPWFEGAPSDAACVAALAGAPSRDGLVFDADVSIALMGDQVYTATGVLAVDAGVAFALPARGDQPVGNTDTVETARDRRQVPAWAS